MNQLVQDTKTDYEKLLGHFKVKTNSELSIEQLKEAIDILERKK